MNDAFGHSQTVVVLGGSSDIAGEIVKLMATDRCRTAVLAGRDPSALKCAGEQMRVAGVETVSYLTIDARDTTGVDATVAECFEAAAGHVDVVIVAVGELGRQFFDEVDADRVAQMLTVNFTWPAAALSAVATRLMRQGHGSIIVLSSVAGLRVRRANYLYGSAKGGLDAYAQGLAESLRGSGVAVHIVRPGFVQTKMTKGLARAPFAIEPQDTATAVLAGVERHQKFIWAPSILQWIFLVLRYLPGPIWRRLPG